MYGNPSNQTQQIQIRVETSDGLQTITVPATTNTSMKADNIVNNTIQVTSPIVSLTGLKRKLEPGTEVVEMKHESLISATSPPVRSFLLLTSAV